LENTHPIVIQLDFSQEPTGPSVNFLELNHEFGQFSLPMRAEVRGRNSSDVDGW
jgi:hypothetical protein